jgi:baculoviral IAP repeat-containing protein 6
MLLQQASTDKLRVIAEFLLDTLLGMTVCGPTIPQIPVALYEAFSPAFAALLFRSLCVHGTRKTQTHAGVLLVRVCSSQPWWGEFLGNMLEEFFSSDQIVSAFPQDR